MATLDENSSFSGFQLGIVIGAIVALFKAPRIRRPSSTPSGNDNESSAGELDIRNIGRTFLNTITPSDPIEESIAEGKEAARRRRLGLGLDQASNSPDT